MLIDDLEEFCISTIGIEPYAGQDEYGDPSFGASVFYQGRIEIKNRMIRDAKGQERVSMGKIFLQTQTVISPKDRITLPSGYSPTNPEILAVYPVQADEGIDHIVVMF